jgi:hypothetical protein
MAGGGLTSIPLNMHHDFAAGGIIAFADGGYPSEYGMPQDKSVDEIRQEREAEEVKRGIVADPYADVKRRYAEIEEKQKASEKDAGYRNVIASLAAMGSGKPRRFGEAMANYAETATNLENNQQKLSEQNAIKMAELQTLFAERDDARRRGDLVADRAVQDKISEKKKEMLGLRHQYTNAETAREQAAAHTSTAKTQAEKEAEDRKNYPREMALKEMIAKAQLAHANKPSEQEQRLNLFKTNREAYNAMYGAGAKVLTQDQMMDNWQKMPFLEKEARKKRAGGDVLKAEQDYYKEVRGLASAPSGGTNPYANQSNAQILQALGR